METDQGPANEKWLADSGAMIHSVCDPVRPLSHKRLANTDVLMIPFALIVTLGIIPIVRLVYDSIDRGKVSSPSSLPL